MTTTQSSQDMAWKSRYNKTFELRAWLELEPPPHMTMDDWRLAVYSLHTMLTETDGGKSEPDELIIGWKSQHGLL